MLGELTRDYNQDNRMGSIRNSTEFRMVVSIDEINTICAFTSVSTVVAVNNDDVKTIVIVSTQNSIELSLVF